MLINKELKRALIEVNDNKVTQFSFAGSLFTLKISDKKDTIELSAPVYWGGNYIPQSVRACSKQRAPFDERIISTFLTTDEETFSIQLNYKGNRTPAREELSFDAVFEEFGFLVNEWKEWLDQNDKNDLVHVYSKR